MPDPQETRHMADAAYDLRRLPGIGEMGVIALVPGFRFFYDGSALCKLDRRAGFTTHPPGSEGARETALRIISEVSGHPSLESAALISEEKPFVVDIAEERSYVRAWDRFFDEVVSLINSPFDPSLQPEISGLGH